MKTFTCTEGLEYFGKITTKIRGSKEVREMEVAEQIKVTLYLAQYL